MTRVDGMTACNRLREGPLKQDLREECLRMDVSAVAEQHDAGEREEWNKKAAHERFDDRIYRRLRIRRWSLSSGRASRRPGGIRPE